MTRPSSKLSRVLQCSVEIINNMRANVRVIAEGVRERGGFTLDSSGPRKFDGGFHGATMEGLGPRLPLTYPNFGAAAFINFMYWRRYLKKRFCFERLKTCDLEQGSANYSLGTKSGPSSISVNKISILEPSRTHSFIYCL